MKLRSGLFLLLLCQLLAACTTPWPEPSDGRPLRDISAEAVVDAKPGTDPVLAAGNTSPYRVNGVEYRVLASSQGYRERGLASWYGSKFHGRKTANGEVFDAYAATAAHRSLPLPSYLRVTNLDTYQSMVVRVNDRGPFHADRIVDLSYGAAVKLGFAEQGTARVELVAISVQGTDDLRTDPEFADWRSDYRFLQVGSFSEERSAVALQQQLAAQLSAAVEISEFQRDDGAWYRVRIGPLEDRRRLQEIQAQLVQLGYLNVRAMPQ
jgi:rare lipoprotein A